MSWRASTTAPTSSSSTPAASSTAHGGIARRHRRGMAENGKVIVTGCMGAEPEQIEAAYPGVLSITGPQQYASVLEAVRRACRRSQPASRPWCRRRASS